MESLYEMDRSGGGGRIRGIALGTIRGGRLRKDRRRRQAKCRGQKGLMGDVKDRRNRRENVTDPPVVEDVRSGTNDYMKTPGDAAVRQCGTQGSAKDVPPHRNWSAPKTGWEP